VRSDVAIIGAGVHGASAAYHLALRGVSTVVFEQNTPASGPTGQSSAIVRSYYTNPFLAEVARDSTRFFEEFDARTNGGDGGYRRTGGLYLHGDDDVAHVRRTADGMATLGIDHEVLLAPALAERFPMLSLHDIAIGVWEECAGYADPHQSAVGFVAAAKRSGTQVFSHTRVVRIKEQPRSVRLELGDGSSHEVGTVLIAAGPWSRPLANQVGFNVPLTVERHVVAGLGFPSHATPPSVSHLLLDVVGGYYSRPLEPNQFLLGGLVSSEEANPDNFSTAITDLEFAWLAERAIERVPSRAAAVARSSWASVYDVSPDWQPVIGQVSEHTFIDAGTSGHGFKLAPVLGEHVARLLVGDADDRLAQFSPARFTTGSFLSSGFGDARILG
jgi:glycine/D-amino acid oxidase-like deaminating enzyme